MKKHLFLFFTALMAFSFMSCEKGSSEGELNAPKGFKVSQSGSSLVLEWQAVSGAESYSLTKNAQFWQTTSGTRVVDENPVTGVNTYTLVASDGTRVSSKVSVSYNFQGSGQGGEDPQQSTYYIKHPWNGGTWEWKKMEYEGEGQYSCRDCYWGGTGANINTSATDEGAQWFPAAQIDGADQAKEGDKGTFVYIANSKELYFVVEDPGENPQMTSFYIKHPWGGSSEWTWQPMEKNGNAYTYTGVWGGTGANINTSASDSGSEWYPASSISGASSLTNGTTVTFSFISTNGPVGSLSVSSNGGGGTTTVPSTPEGLTATASSSSISLRWNSVSGATSYNVYRATSAGGNYTKLDNVGNTSYTDYDVSAGSTYYYKVTAQNGAGESARSSAVSATISSGGNTPNAPSNLKATAGTSCINLTWNSVSGATKYYVYRSNSSSGNYTKIDNTTSTSYSDCDVNVGTTYYYKVSAENGNGEGAQSSSVSAKISSGGSTTNKPNTPGGLKATAGESCIDISWNSVSNATRYYLYRSTSASANYTILTETTSTSYKDCNVSINTSYYYKVSAYNNDGESALSSYVTAKISISKPSAPQNLKATQEDDIIKLTWKEVSTASKYYIYRSTSQYSGYTLLNECTSNSYDDNYALISGTTYYYKVSAVNIAGEGSQSSVAYCKYEKIYAPCAPKNVSVTKGYSSIKIQWEINTASGCGKPTKQVVLLWNTTKYNWDEKTPNTSYSGGSYEIYSSYLNNYIDNLLSDLVFIIKLENEKGTSMWEFTYNYEEDRITHYEEK